ncbi:MAG: hypothetical protein Q8O92_03350 [Candidatus Latescibacter sp.]|nr:hypothetical protein [Candidatus Latescibacter sp.]
MPDESVHILLAKHNQDLINHLLENKSQFHDWITIAAFYKALHIVEALFFNDPEIRHGQNHENRDRFLKTNNKYKNIYIHYRPLWAAATIARYLEGPRTSTVNSFSEYMSPDDVISIILNNHLLQVEKSAQKFLSPQNASLL